MIKDLKNEMNNFMQDIETKITNQEERDFILDRTAQLFNVIVDEMENVLDYKTNEIQALESKQKEIDGKMDDMEAVLKNITRDIYEDEEDFEIICPYCNNEFDADVDENVTEVVCPECENTIELDWGIEEDNNCNGNCSGCNGCENE